MFIPNAQKIHRIECNKSNQHFFSLLIFLFLKSLREIASKYLRKSFFPPPKEAFWWRFEFKVVRNCFCHLIYMHPNEISISLFFCCVSVLPAEDRKLFCHHSLCSIRKNTTIRCEFWDLQTKAIAFSFRDGLMLQNCRVRRRLSEFFWREIKRQRICRLRENIEL